MYLIPAAEQTQAPPLCGANDLVAPLLRADVDASINNLVEHWYAILVGEALEGILCAETSSSRWRRASAIKSIDADALLSRSILRTPCGAARRRRRAGSLSRREVGRTSCVPWLRGRGH